MAELVQDLDVRHQPMAADDPWEGLLRWKKRDLLLEGDDFFLSLTRLINRTARWRDV
jgi:hypothetical protein